MFEMFRTVVTHAQGMWRFRWFASLVALPLCLFGWLFVYSMPDVYQARAQIYIDTQSVLKPLLDGLAVRTEVNDRVGMMTRALVSRPSLVEIARTIRPEFDTVPALRQQAVLNRLQRRIYISPGELENIYDMQYQDEDRARALLVVELLLHNLVEDTVGLTRTDTTIAQEFLDTQIAEYEARLRAAEQRLAAFKKQHVGMMPSQGEDYYSRLQESMTALEDTGDAVRLATQRRDELRRQLGGEEPVFGMVASPALKGTSDLDQLISKHETELESLRLQFTDQHPDVVVLKEIVAQLKARRLESAQGPAKAGNGTAQSPALSLVYQATTIALSEAEIEVSALRTKEAQLQSRVSELKESVDTIPEVEAQLTSLNRDYDITKAAYEALAQRLQSARLSEEAEQSSDEIKFRIIEPPVAPLKPVGPNRPLFLTVVLAAGLLAGAGLTFMLHQIRPVFLNSRKLGESIQLPILGVVSLQRRPVERLRHRVEFASFMLVMLLLICMYGSVVLMHEDGARAMQALVSEWKVQS